MTISAENLKDRVRADYAAALEREAAGGCCGSAELVRIGYDAEAVGRVPDEARRSSFGCGHPLGAVDLAPGDVVVDVGSGAGLDALLAAERVGPRGEVVGVDMTPAMVERARRAAAKARATNVRFVLAEAEAMPLRSSSADHVVSNCVVNLAPDKGRVFREAFRVLRPGGRLTIGDIVAALPRWLRRPEWHSACVSGALPEEDYLAAIRGAGFVDVRVASRRPVDACRVGLGRRLGLGGRLGRLVDRLVGDLVRRRAASLVVTARKPSRSDGA